MTTARRDNIATVKKEASMPFEHRIVSDAAGDGRRARRAPAIASRLGTGSTCTGMMEGAHVDSGGGAGMMRGYGLPAAPLAGFGLANVGASDAAAFAHARFRPDLDTLQGDGRGYDSLRVGADPAAGDRRTGDAGALPQGQGVRTGQPARVEGGAGAGSTPRLPIDPAGRHRPLRSHAGDDIGRWYRPVLLADPARPGDLQARVGQWRRREGAVSGCGLDAVQVAFGPGLPLQPYEPDVAEPISRTGGWLAAAFLIFIAARVAAKAVGL